MDMDTDMGIYMDMDMDTVIDMKTDTGTDMDMDMYRQGYIPKNFFSFRYQTVPILARSISDYCRLKHRYCDWSDI